MYLCLARPIFCHLANLSEFGIKLTKGLQPEENVDDALMVFTKHHDLIDTFKLGKYNNEIFCGSVEVLCTSKLKD